MAADGVIKKDTGEVIATGVTFEEYMDKYAGDFCELVAGEVIKMSPVTAEHVLLCAFLFNLFQSYFALRPIGKVMAAPFVMKLPTSKPKREPDLQIILDSNPAELTSTYLDGPADICIEVVSPGSLHVDRGQKFTEYEKGGVKEYWMFDPIHRESLFYRLNSEGVYIPQRSDQDGNYRTPALPNFVLHIPTLWECPLPNPGETFDLVKAMLG